MQVYPVGTADWLVILPVILPLLGATILLMLQGKWQQPALSAALVSLVVCICDAALLTRVMNSGPVAMTMGRWLPPFGISFVADTSSAVFALLAAFVTFIVLLYMRSEDGEAIARSGLFPLVLVLLAGVDGAFLTGDLFNLYVWFEVMLIASFGLLVASGTPLAIDATVKYGILNFVATSLFLAALGLLYGALGTLNMADVIGSASRAPPAIVTSIAALLLVAFSIKAAPLPFNAWLPASYHAPPAAISALFGGLLTKVGVYALLRTFFLWPPTSRDSLTLVLASLSAATLLLAPLGAIAETNLRRAIGYLLIGGIGSALAGIALPSAVGAAGTVAYVANAMLTISALYLVAGLIERRTGELDTRRMGGLYAASSPLSMLFLLSIVTVAGVPPFLGFWPKLLLLQAGLDLSGSAGGGNTFALPLACCLLVNALLTLFAGARLWSHIFWRPRPQDVNRPGAVLDLARPAPGRQLLPISAAAILSAVVVAGGLWPEPLLAVAKAAAGTLLDSRPYVAAVGIGGTP